MLCGAASAGTIDPARYLTQYRCPGDDPPTECVRPAPQVDDDLVNWRRHDWPAPRGYSAADGVMLTPGRYVSTWVFAPFGRFDPARGDGGEIYRVEAGTVRIELTQDGGTPGIQRFVGTKCGGTGWIAFRADAPTGSWAELVATLAIAPADTECPSLKQAYTRYRRERVTMPFIRAAGAEIGLSIDAVIAEHYNAGSLTTASALERSYFGAGWGRLRWEAWHKGGAAPVDLSARCPARNAPAYSAPPAPGWVMVDCRMWTIIVSGPAARVADFGWAPLAAAP